MTMFKQLRNKLLITNLAVTTALVLCGLTAIFVTTYTFVNNEIDRQLDLAVRLSMPGTPESAGISPPSPADPAEKPDNMPGRAPAPEDEAYNTENGHEPEPLHSDPIPDRFRTEFSVRADADGNVISANMTFNADESDYADVIKDIIASGRQRGTIKLDVSSWAYKTVRWDTGYIIAFTPNASQRKILLNLVMILVLAAVISVIITYLISLFSANRSIRPIEEAYNKQKQFVADASHELRTPLASISANADVLLSKPNSTIEAEKKWLIYIKDETERMTRLTNELLYLARSDPGNEEKMFSEVCFSDIVDDIVLENEAAAFENKLMLSYHSGTGIKVTASEEGLRQLVLILIDNALKYTPEHGAVNITLRSEGDKAVLTVKNSGSINKADLPHIFERFYRADKSRLRESGGFGLGLAIAKNIAESFGGTLAADSDDTSTVFTLTLALR